MIGTFDLYNVLEKPSLTLCNPDGMQLFSLDNAQNLELKLKFNALSEINFSIREKINDEYFEPYPYVISKRYVLVEHIGYFVITNPEEIMGEEISVKNITALSVEVEFNYKRLIDYSGTKNFVDLLNELVVLFPSWSIGYIDPALVNISRTFEINDSTVYNFLMTDVESAYGCVFIFDPMNRIISAYQRANATTNTDIYLSFNSVTKKLDIREKSDELTTCFHVQGKDTLDIRNVNPTGTDTIYNFDYFKNDSWMTRDLQDAITNWGNNILANQTQYATLLTNLVITNEEMVVLNTVLVDLTNQLNTQHAILQVRIQSGQPTDDIVVNINNLTILINNQNLAIANKQLTIDYLEEQLQAINDICRIENNFTIEQFRILDSYIIENIYKNDSFIQTDVMTHEEVKNMSLDLYNFSKDVLIRASQPRVEFRIESANFLFIKEFQPFINQISLGANVSLEFTEDNVIYPTLLQMELNYDDPENFSLTFGNALRLDDPSFIYSDLYGETIKGRNSGFGGGGRTESVTTGPAAENRILQFKNGVYKGFIYN